MLEVWLNYRFGYGSENKIGSECVNGFVDYVDIDARLVDFLEP